jgi:hypothetical protein
MLIGKWIGNIWQSDGAYGNGSTVVYNTSVAISSNGSVFIYLNGLLCDASEYAIVGSQITFNVAPANAQRIIVKYIKKA